MSFLMKNIAAIRKDVGVEQAQLENLVDKATKRYELITSRTGDYGLIYHGEEGNSTTIHSKYDPIREATRIVDNTADIPEADIIVVMGFGLGYHVEVLVQRLRKQQQIFIVEPMDGPCILAMNNRDLTATLSKPNVHLLITDSPKNTGESFDHVFDVQRDSKVAVLFFPPQQKIFEEFFQQANQSLVDRVHFKKMEENTLKAIGFDIIESSVLNLSSYLSSPGIKETFDKFSNVPAFIVAAGPSLNKNIQLLKQVKDKGVIIAVGTAVSALQLHNIQPDVVVSIDPGHWNFKVFEKLTLSDTIMVADLQTNYKIVDQFTGPKFMFSNVNNLIKEWLYPFYEDKSSFLLSGGSVANSACCLAYRMGCNPITFVGQDLCLSEDGHTHSVGTLYETWLGNVNDTIYVQGNNGEKVRTMHNWYRFLQWFEDFISSNNDRRYINATEGGAYIKGTECLPLSEVIAQYCKQDIKPKERLLAIAENYKLDTLIKQKAIAMLDEKIKEVGNISKKIEKARLSLSNINREAGSMNRCLQDKLLQQIASINQYLNNSKEYFIIEQIDYSIVADTLKKTHASTRSEEDTFSSAASDTIAYYKAMLEAANTFNKILAQAKERLMGDEEYVNK